MKKRILVIDDEPELREVIKDLLEGYNLYVETAQDGLEGIKMISESLFDLVISDHKMPKKTGLDVLKWMRSENIHIPFILQTGHGQKQLHSEASQYNVLAIFDKPWDQELLIKTIRGALGL